jgi:DNA-binding response OmpR family regulator
MYFLWASQFPLDSSAIFQLRTIIYIDMKVLLVEDEHKIANSIKKGLEQEVYAVDVAYDGTTGFDLASSEDYDVIVLDLMLPDIDGLTICKKLRVAGNHTPILMLTARGQLEDKVTGLNSGADDYLVKPFAFTELLARIKALTRRPKDSFGTILSVADLTLNTLTYEVSRSGKPIRLSRKEFALLEYLLRHANAIVTKDQIINNTWNYDSDILPNTVEVYIGYLRHKIPGLIHTVRGFGYKIGVAT